MFASGVLSSLCTVQRRIGAVSNFGQPDLSNWVDVAGLTNLVCMLSVQSTYRPNQQGTKRMPTDFELEAERHLYINGYYPNILAQYSILVWPQTGTVADAIRYEIMSGSENDSQYQTTRLALRTWTQ